MFNASINKPSTEFIKQVLVNFSITCPGEIDLAGYQGDLTNDSRKISDQQGVGDIFCAVIGHVQDGRDYIQKAVDAGAKLVLAECETQNEHGNISYVNNTVAIISFYQLNKNLLALASDYYQSPENKMTMIGVTGTNGKTSTCQLLGQTLTNSEKPCAIIGTNGAGMIEALQPLDNTTPSATELMQLFFLFSQKQNSEQGKNQTITHLAMEVSSHALEQSRVSGDIFDIAIFTNLSRDHLDYHGTMADYAAAKRQLFTNNDQQIAVLNGDDTQARFWLEQWPTQHQLAQQNLWLYGQSEIVRQHAQFVSCNNIVHHSHGVDFTLNTHLGDVEIKSPLLGDFNIDNLLAVIAVLMIEGIDLNTIAEKVAQIKAIAGRMEAFSANHLPTGVVDYAHTPDALEKALIACRQHCQGQLFVVFGCGGDRDKGKRPLMAQAAQKYADALVITNDNPRTESPMSIVDDILIGLTKRTHVEIILDRKQAVLTTLAKAKAGDVVLLAGKGHEDYIIMGDEKIDYNEREIVKDFFAQTNEIACQGETL